MSSLSAGPETLVIGTEKCTELMRMRKDDVISQNENEKRLKLDREREREGLEREHKQEDDNLSRERALRGRREVIIRKHALLESQFHALMADGYSYENCVVCTNTIGKLFALRCGHTSTCAKCLKQLDACPICRCSILPEEMPIKPFGITSL